VVVPEGSSQISGVGACPKGYVCSSTTFPKLCKPRYYCKSGLALTEEVLCQKGSYNPYYGKSKCYKCPIGYYCPEIGMLTPRKCPK